VFRCLTVIVTLLSCANVLIAAPVTSFEILVDDRLLLEASTADQSLDSEVDSDAVWSSLQHVCFQPVGGSENSDRWSVDQPVTLSGSIELRVPYGGRVTLRQLRLMPCIDGQATRWKLHPADFLATFRVRARLDQAASRRDKSPPDLPNRPLVIAHRGASGYLPEHTQEAASLAWGMRADIIEQDVVLTRDGVPIVAHDIHLDTVTDIADQFPERARLDGRWYAIDFDLNEIKSLRVNERVEWPSRQPAFPARFPRKGRFEVPTLAEMIELIQGLNQTTGRDVGIYPELKQPGWHREQGYDLTQSVLAVLDRYGYRSKRQHAYLQCFEADELRRLRDEFGCRLPLVQLLGNDQAADRMWTREGLKEIATYAHGVGPRINRVVAADAAGKIELSSLVQVAHQMGLVVHTHTVRRENLPAGFADDVELLERCRAAGVDGLFCDFPDRAVTALER
jgi:glycerophosphoryl diester phosphodiesterase